MRFQLWPNHTADTGTKLATLPDAWRYEGGDRTLPMIAPGPLERVLGTVCGAVRRL